jgi:hypothetical protein
MHDAHLNMLHLLTSALKDDSNRAEQVEAGSIPVQEHSFAPSQSHPKFFIYYIIPNYYSVCILAPLAYAM